MTKSLFKRILLERVMNCAICDSPATAFNKDPNKKSYTVICEGGHSLNISYPNIRKAIYTWNRRQAALQISLSIDENENVDESL